MCSFHISTTRAYHTICFMSMDFIVDLLCTFNPLGHANIEMTLNLYAHVLEEMSQHAAIVMDDFMKDS